MSPVDDVVPVVPAVDRDGKTDWKKRGAFVSGPCAACGFAPAFLVVNWRGGIWAITGTCKCTTLPEGAELSALEDGQIRPPSQPFGRCISCHSRVVSQYEWIRSTQFWASRGGRCDCAVAVITPARPEAWEALRKSLGMKPISALVPAALAAELDALDNRAII